MAPQTLSSTEAHEIRVALYTARHVARNGFKLCDSGVAMLTKALAIVGEPGSETAQSMAAE